MTYDIQYQNGGFQTKGQACGRRSNDQGTGYSYAGIVVRLALMIAAPNYLEVKLGNILNAYIQTAVTKKV